MSFRLQAAIIGLATLSMTVLALLLIQDVLRNTEQAVGQQARDQCMLAVKGLAEQYAERNTYGEPLSAVPPAARDVSLRGLSGAVLRSFSGVDGGFAAIASIGDFEHAEIVTRSLKNKKSQAQIIVSGNDLVAVAALPVDSDRVAWAAKRIAGILDPAQRQERFLLAALTCASLVTVLGLISITLYLRRGVAGIRADLGRVAVDSQYRPKKRSGEFGQIAEAVGAMAERRAKLESDLRMKDRLAALGRVAAGVAHEVRNPLNAMRLTLELLEKRTNRGVATSTEVQKAIEQVDRLNRVVNQLLTFGKVRLGSRELTSLSGIVHGAATLVAEELRSRDIVVEIHGGESIECEVDAAQIQQVMLNLLLNALEFSPAHSRIEILISSSRETARIEVTDQGSGIPDEHAPHLFEAFYTTRAEGTGLGLAVSREIVNQHSGSISFRTSGSGSTFVVELPLRSEPVDAAMIGAD